MNTARNLLLVCFAFGYVPSAGVAAIIYSQTTPEEPGAAFASSNIIGRQKIADNFLVSGTGRYTVRSLRFIGTPGALGDAQGPLPDDAQDNFRVVFLENVAGSPGAPLSDGDYSITSVARRRPTGGRLLNGVGTPVEFVLNLGEGITLDRGTEYWLSVSNNPVPTGGWAWARAVGVLDQDMASTLNEVDLGPWNASASGGGMWFELSTQNIPEPTSILLICSGFACLILLRHRR